MDEILSEVVAYVVAVAAATPVMLFVIGVHTGDPSAFSLFPLVAVFMLGFALPGALVARFILGWRQWDGFAAYSAAGTTVGMVTGVLPQVIGGGWFWRDHGPIAVAMGLAGLTGGFVFHAVRRRQRKTRIADEGPMPHAEDEP